MVRFIGFVSTALLAAMFAAQTAFAGGGTAGAGYPGAGVSGNVESRVSETNSVSQLPFTGLDLVVVVVGAVALLGFGALLLVRNRPERGRNL